MKLKFEIYCCTECKKIVEDVHTLLFVEENTQKAFCSETCIEDFYRPMVQYFSDEVSRLRIQNYVSNENFEHDTPEANFDEDFYVEELTRSADEIWCYTNELKEETYYYIKFRRTFMTCIICTHFNGGPSFIFSLIKTKSQKLINEFRVGNKLDHASNVNQSSSEIDEDIQFLTMLENKKSSLLGELLSEWKDNDINIENFNNFEIAFNETLSVPDEIYEIKDREGDLTFNYLKSFMDKEIGNYFYVIVCLKTINDKSETNIFPILSFPTIDPKLFMKFRVGTKVMSIISN